MTDEDIIFNIQKVINGESLTAFCRQKLNVWWLWDAKAATMPSYSKQKPIRRTIYDCISNSHKLLLYQKEAIKVGRHWVHQEECDSLAAEQLPSMSCVPCCVLIPHLYFPSVPVTLLNRGLQHGNEKCCAVPVLILELRDGWHRLNHNGIKKGGQSTDWKTRRGVAGSVDKGSQREHKGCWSSGKDLFTNSQPEF